MISPLRLARVRAATQTAFRTAQIDLAFDQTNPEALRWARTRAARLVTEIDASTRAAIRRIIAMAFKEGIPPREAAQMIRPLVGHTERDVEALSAAWERLMKADGGDLVKVGQRSYRVPSRWSKTWVKRVYDKYADKLIANRALLIARTETIAASNEGQRQLWTQAQAEGLIAQTAKRVWITTFDDRECPTCAGMDGQTRLIDEPFDAGPNGEVMSPPAHPACRCSMGIVSQTARKAA